MTDENKSSFRIEKLEAANRRIRWALGLCIALSALFSTFILADRARTRSTLEAKEFLLRDESGQVVARLGSSSVGTCFEILGKTKEASAVICAGDESGSDFLLTTHHGQSRAFLSAGSKMYESVGESVLPGLLIAEDGKGLISATVGTEQKLAIARGAGENAIVISVHETKPVVSLLNSNGKILWTAP